MKYFIYLAVFVGIAFGNNNTIHKCNYVATDGSVYDLSPLHKRNGSAYEHTDKNGNTWFFNVCGDLNGLTLPQENPCPKDTTVCLVTAQKKGINAGKFAFALFGDYANGANNGVEIVYGQGDECESSKIPRKTTFEFICSYEREQNTPALQVRKVTPSADGCYNVITVVSPTACPLGWEGGGDDMGGEEGEDDSFASLFSIFVFFFMLASVTFCCCACCARKKRNQKINRQQQEEMVQYSNQMWIPQEHQEYIPAPYFVYPQVPIHVDVEQQSLVSADAQLARELQAKYDSEQ